MPPIIVEFRFCTGLPRAIFRNVSLRGSWDSGGRYCDQWTESPMTPVRGADGGCSYIGTVQLSPQEVGTTFRWGVILDGPYGANTWGLPTEIRDATSSRRERSFKLRAVAATRQVECYYLTRLRQLGANPETNASGSTNVRFAVWAPNAKSVEVLFAAPSALYIDDMGAGIDPAVAPVRMAHSATTPWDGIWEATTVDSLPLLEGRRYMFRLTNVATGVTRSRFHQDHRVPGIRVGRKLAMGTVCGEADRQRRQ